MYVGTAAYVVSNLQLVHCFVIILLKNELRISMQ